MSDSRIIVTRSQHTDPSARAGDTFTGEVWRDTVIAKQDGIGAADVFFTPGARTFWHTHEGGQILFIRSGVGYVGDEHEVIRVEAGDTVWTPPGVRHWHGAVPDRSMLHTAMSIRGVEWGDAVTDEEYGRGVG
ncbi:cupin domain-containing protein [Cnuibacter physcomitrellae]|uniref:cupin domain-containing protein n=1 Tax=Cnuibacter physcomitrellae TaxID=1619308 RepID=UPI002175DEB5|nr:cupin domain-containing protein [Cnuibacter physcomitrellae]MCS5498314.1 cupin domain-containing protein [Cnuibacter physcomitrellae]